MDLSLMMRKLKNFQYRSKADVVEDLTQMYKNCVTFNPQPNNIYVAAINAMQRKWLLLLRHVPDVVVRDPLGEPAEIKPVDVTVHSDDEEDIVDYSSIGFFYVSGFGILDKTVRPILKDVESSVPS